MSEAKHSHNPDDRPEKSGNHYDHRPFWKRAHRSLSFWIAVVLMLVAMVVYAMSDNLGGWRRSQMLQPISAPVGK